MYFCKGYDYGEKEDLTKGYWDPKRKMRVTTHFSEIIMYGNFFPNLSTIISEKCMVTPNFLYGF